MLDPNTKPTNGNGVTKAELVKRHAAAFTAACIPKIADQYTADDWDAAGYSLQAAADAAHAVANHMRKHAAEVAA